MERRVSRHLTTAEPPAHERQVLTLGASSTINAKNKSSHIWKSWLLFSNQKECHSIS